jgi:hypothetical protein
LRKKLSNHFQPSRPKKTMSDKDVMKMAATTATVFTWRRRYFDGAKEDEIKSLLAGGRS